MKQPIYLTWDKTPIPYKRMTQRSKYMPENQAYLACKNDLAVSIKVAAFGRDTYKEGEAVSVSVVVSRSRNTGDVDNYLKLVLDALQESGVIVNDKQVQHVVALRMPLKTNLQESRLLMRLVTHGEAIYADEAWRFVTLRDGLFIIVRPMEALYQD